METITRAPWPGNVRQLQNTLRRAVILADGPVIRPQDLHGLEGAPPGSRPAGGERGDSVRGDSNETAGERPNGHGTVALRSQSGHVRRLREIEADAIAEALRLYRGRMSEAARRLGIGRSTLYRKIDEYRLGQKEA